MINNYINKIITNGNGICIISNIEYGSDKERFDRIKEIYDICEAKGIDTIINCGNLSAKFNKQENKTNTEITNDLIEYITNNHPYSKNIKFYTISGNNEISHLEKNNINICEGIIKKRNDIIYLGDNEVDVVLDDLNVRLSSGKINGELDESYNIKKNIKDNSNIDLVCKGPCYSARHEILSNTHILCVPSVSDVGGSFSHIIWLVDTKQKNNINITDFKLESSYDKKIEEDIKTDETILQRIMKLHK